MERELDAMHADELRAERAAERARAALGPGSARWPGMSPAERRRTYLEVLNGLREVLAVNNDSDPWLERRRNALITAEILFNDKSPADVAVLYAPLLNADDALLPLLLSREGEFEKRRVALAKKLTDLVLSSGMAGAAALPRYRQFLAAMDGLLPAPAAAESGNSALRGTVLFLALLAPLAWLAAAVPGGLWPGVEFLAGGGPASWWENTWLGPLVLPMARATQFTVNTVDGMYGPMDEKTALAVVTSRVAHGEKVQVFRMIPCSVSMAINLSPPKRPYKTRQPKP
jgi:hypothetical protein